MAPATFGMAASRTRSSTPRDPPRRDDGHGGPRRQRRRGLEVRAPAGPVPAHVGVDGTGRARGRRAADQLQRRERQHVGPPAHGHPAVDRVHPDEDPSRPPPARGLRARPARAPRPSRARPSGRRSPSAASRAVRSRSPPPTWTGTAGIASTIARIRAAWRGAPSNAPSRSTTWSRPAPRSAHRRAIATGSSPKTVALSARPSTSRTQRPALEVDRGDDDHARAASPAAGEPGEVREEPEPPALALLRMELGAEQPVAHDQGREADAVLAVGRSHALRVERGRHLGVVRVHEVEVRAGGDPREEGQGPVVPEPVPAHVGHLEPGRKPAHHPGQDVETLGVAELLALGEQELVAQADPEIGPAGRDVGADRLDEPEALEAPHGVREGAVPGDDQRASARHRPGVLGDHDVGHELGQRLPDAAEVAPAVVDDRDHKAPFVESTPSMRGFMREASARARPNALNSASAMWCRFSP